MSRFLVIGGAHLDRRGRIIGPATLGASNPGHWREEAGGGAFNSARNLARLGHQVRMIAPRGGDREGALVAAAAEAAGIIDMPLTFLDRATPSYTAILDEEGELVVALADMALYDLFSPRQCARRSLREAIGETDAVLCDANLPEATLAALAHRCREQQRPLAAIGVSPAKIVRLCPALVSLMVLFLNSREATALCGTMPEDPAGWPTLLRAEGVAAAVVTGGADAAIVFDSVGAWQVTPITDTAVVDVTGAGDALAAAAFAALVAGIALPEAARHGVAAAALTVASADAVSQALDAAALARLLERVPPALPLHHGDKAATRPPLTDIEPPEFP